MTAQAAITAWVHAYNHQRQPARPAPVLLGAQSAGSVEFDPVISLPCN